MSSFTRTLTDHLWNSPNRVIPFADSIYGRQFEEGGNLCALDLGDSYNNAIRAYIGNSGGLFTNEFSIFKIEEIGKILGHPPTGKEFNAFFSSKGGLDYRLIEGLDAEGLLAYFTECKKNCEGSRLANYGVISQNKVMAHLGVSRMLESSCELMNFSMEGSNTKEYKEVCEDLQKEHNNTSNCLKSMDKSGPKWKLPIYLKLQTGQSYSYAGTYWNYRTKDGLKIKDSKNFDAVAKKIKTFHTESMERAKERFLEDPTKEFFKGGSDGVDR
tara:strand:+ start:33 stop:845 length:813 start_codon:yes stop_codon:yes gene_type:complete